MHALSVAIAAAALGLVGCNARFTETHYFASTDQKTNKPINYYRVTVDGRVFGGDARYLSGYFDPDAVEAYFGEFSQPDSATFAAQPRKTGDEPEIESVDPRKANRQLVMILSSNSDKVANEIGTIAQSQQLAGSLAVLASGDRLRELEDASSAAKRRNAQVTLTIRQLSAAFEALGDTPSAADLDRRLLPLFNELARVLGATETFTTFEQAAAWAAGLERSGR